MPAGGCPQVKPLLQELFFLSDAKLRQVQAVGLLLAAALQLLSVRQLVQAYMDTVVVHWHSLKHGPKKVGRAPMHAVPPLAECVQSLWQGACKPSSGRVHAPRAGGAATHSAA